MFLGSECLYKERITEATSTAHRIRMENSKVFEDTWNLFGPMWEKVLGTLWSPPKEMSNGRCIVVLLLLRMPFFASFHLVDMRKIKLHVFLDLLEVSTLLYINDESFLFPPNALRFAYATPEQQKEARDLLNCIWFN